VHELRSLQAALDGELITPDSAGYDAARRPALARFHDVRPIAVVSCASTRDVVRTLAFARHSGTHVVPRGGGHCFAGRSSTAGLVLDLSRFDAVTVRPDGSARIGAGARLAQVYDGLHRSRRAVPTGCGPRVGIAGLTLGGGLGLLGRRNGLTCDALLSAQVVLADGRVVDCDLDREPELFWALRGAGGGQFGVVTCLVFATVAEPRATRFGRSEFFSHPIPASAVGSLIDELTSGVAPGRRELSFTAMGGAYNRVPADATAFVHRSERFLLEHVAHGGDQWLDRSWTRAHAHASGRVYPNFPDPDLDDWAAAYHGGNTERLRAVKRRYDPERLFRFPQAI